MYVQIIIWCGEGECTAAIVVVVASLGAGTLASDAKRFDFRGETP
jgi:hypothetical protein